MPKTKANAYTSLMSASAFKTWRKRLALTQSEAATLLGLKSRMIQHYEKGIHTVPRAVRLACYALEQGILDYNGDDFIGGSDPTVLTYLHLDGEASEAKLEKKRGKLADFARSSTPTEPVNHG